MADNELLSLARKCTAHSSRTGQPCQKWAIKGGTVCPTHGGAAPQVRAKAERRLLRMVSPMLARLEELAMQTDDPHVAIRAVQDVLDRAGIGAVVEAKVRASKRDQQGQQTIVNIGFLQPMEPTTHEAAPVLPASSTDMTFGAQVVEKLPPGDSGRD